MQFLNVGSSTNFMGQSANNFTGSDNEIYVVLNILIKVNSYHIFQTQGTGEGEVGMERKTKNLRTAGIIEWWNRLNPSVLYDCDNLMLINYYKTVYRTRSKKRPGAISW